MEEKLETAHAEQTLFLIISQRFIMILSEHLGRCDTDGIDYNTHWYKWTIGRLQQILFNPSRTSSKVFVDIRDFTFHARSRSSHPGYSPAVYFSTPVNATFYGSIWCNT